MEGGRELRGGEREFFPKRFVAVLVHLLGYFQK